MMPTGHASGGLTMTAVWINGNGLKDHLSAETVVTVSGRQGPLITSLLGKRGSGRRAWGIKFELEVF
jgi:hypothetical protein